MATASIKRVDGGKWGRVYETPDGIFPSVTSILEVINKPALMHWSAKEERRMVIQASGDLYDSLPANGPKLDRASWAMSLEQRLGEEKAHQKLANKAKEIGSGVHAYIEYRIRKHLGQAVEEPKLPEGGLHAYAAFQGWARAMNLKPRLIEQMVYSVTHGYAGTMDLLAQLEIPPQHYLDSNGKAEHHAYNRGLTHGGQVMAIIDWKTSKAIYWESALQLAAYVSALIEMGHAQRPLHGMVVRLPKLATDPGFETLFIHDEDVLGLFDTFLSAAKLWKRRAEADKGRT